MLRNASERLTEPYEEAQNPGTGFKYSEGNDSSMFKMQWVVILALVKFMSGFCYNTQSHSQGLVNSGRTVHCLPTEVSSLHVL